MPMCWKLCDPWLPREREGETYAGLRRAQNLSSASYGGRRAHASNTGCAALLHALAMGCRRSTKDHCDHVLSLRGLDRAVRDLGGYLAALARERQRITERCRKRRALNGIAERSRSCMFGLRDLSVCRRIRGGSRRFAWSRCVASVSDCLHFVLVYLLHGVDFLRCGRLCCAFGT